MTSSQKKVLIIYCGSLENITEQNFSEWLKKMPELEIMADIESLFTSPANQNFFSSGFWQETARLILKNQHDFNGFVIIHPIETLLYTACAQSFLLNNIKKPIIFTGQPEGKKENKSQSGIKANLINAVQVATYDLFEVAVMFGNKLIRANQASRTQETSLNSFEGGEKAVLGKIDFSIRIFEKHLKTTSPATKLKPELNPNIEYLKIQPTVNVKELNQRLENKRGIFIEGHGHTLPKDIENLLSDQTLKIPVVLFDIKTSFNDKNIINIANMTLEAALIKFMYVLAQTDDLSEIKKLMQQDIAGEIINN